MYLYIPDEIPREGLGDAFCIYRMGPPRSTSYKMAGYEVQRKPFFLQNGRTSQVFLTEWWQFFLVNGSFRARQLGKCPPQNGRTLNEIYQYSSGPKGFPHIPPNWLLRKSGFKTIIATLNTKRSQQIHDITTPTSQNEVSQHRHRHFWPVDFGAPTSIASCQGFVHPDNPEFVDLSREYEQLGLVWSQKVGMPIEPRLLVPFFASDGPHSATLLFSVKCFRGTDWQCMTVPKRTAPSPPMEPSNPIAKKLLMSDSCEGKF